MAQETLKIIGLHIGYACKVILLSYRPEPKLWHFLQNVQKTDTYL